LKNNNSWVDGIDNIGGYIKDLNNIDETQKREVLKHLVKDIIVTYNQGEKCHNLKVNLAVPLIMDYTLGRPPSRRTLCVGEGTNQTILRKPKSGHDYSTVIKFLPSSVLAKDSDAMRYFLTLSIEINIADLWVSHYSEHQQYLYDTIVKFRDQGWSYIKISQWFNDNNILTPRGKQFIPPSVFSIVKKKRISNERFNRTFPSKINDADINIQNTTPTDFK
jgi:hypothetical protein